MKKVSWTYSLDNNDMFCIATVQKGEEGDERMAKIIERLDGRLESD